MVKLRAGHLALATVLLFVTLAALLAWSRLSGSSNATIAQSPNSAPAAQAPSVKNLDGKYISLKYPGDYSLQRQTVHDTDLEMYMLRSTSSYQKKLAIDVATLPADGLNGYAAYLLRLNRPDLYSEQRVQAGTSTVTAWILRPNSDNQAEETVFMVKDNMVATLAFSQQGGQIDDLASDVDLVLNSFQWE